MSADQPGGEHANSPLPEHLTAAGWRVALIVASFNIALPGFLTVFATLAYLIVIRVPFAPSLWPAA